MGKLTVDLPEDLVREVKLRAARENRRLKDLVPELLKRGLEAGSQAAGDKGIVRNRVRFPWFTGGHPAPPGQELTPDRVAQILDDEEVRNHLKASGFSDEEIERRIREA